MTGEPNVTVEFVSSYSDTRWIDFYVPDNRLGDAARVDTIAELEQFANDNPPRDWPVGVPLTPWAVTKITKINTEIAA